MTLGTDATVWLSFAGGLLSFLSPCMLPIYPSYLSYITGVSVREMQGGGTPLLYRRAALLHALAFVTGFSMVFFVLGLSATLLGRLFIAYQVYIQRIGGAAILIFGLVVAGWLQPPVLLRDFRWELRRRPPGYLGSFAVGLVFAAGWTPCVGPILASVLLLSATAPARGIPMILAYIAGFAIPFIALSFAITRLRSVQRYSPLLMRVAGTIMAFMGLLLLTGRMGTVTVWLVRLFGGFSGF